MRVMIMDKELSEPLTIMEVKRYWLPYPLGENLAPFVNFPVIRPLFGLGIPDKNEKSTPGTQAVCTIRFVIIAPYGFPEFVVGYAEDPETALLLRAAFLPGQESEVQRREQIAYIRGALSDYFA